MIWCFSAMALGCGRREAAAQAARGDEAVRPALFAQPLLPGASTGALIASRTSSQRHAGLSMWREIVEGVKARLGSATQPSPGGLVGLEPRLGRERNEAPPGAGQQRDRRASGRSARETLPHAGSDRNGCTHAPAPPPARSRRAGLPPARSPQRRDQQRQRCWTQWRTSTWRRRWASA